MTACCDQHKFAAIQVLVESVTQVTGAVVPLGLRTYVTPVVPPKSAVVPVAVIVPPDVTDTDVTAPLAVAAAGIPHFSFIKFAAVVQPVAPVCIAISTAIL